LLFFITTYFGLFGQVKQKEVFSFSKEMQELRELMKQWELKSIRDLPIAEFLRLKLEKSKEARTLLEQLKNDANNGKLNAESSHVKISKIKNLYRSYQQGETDLASFKFGASLDAGKQEKTTTYTSKSSAVKISTQNSATADTSDLDNENLKKVASMISNEIKIAYGPTFPFENTIHSYGLEFSTGHSLYLAFLRQHEFFYWGGNLGCKWFKNSKVNSVPIYDTIPAGGTNRLINLAACSGVKYFFTDYFFTEAEFSGGIAFAKNELSIGSLSLSESSSEFYFSLANAIGLELNDHWNLSLKYQLDGHTHNSIFRRQLFNQFYLQLGTRL